MIETWSVGVADETMDEEILVALAAVVHRHPWWTARAALTLALLVRLGIRPPARVLDAGCGWGVTLDALERRGYRAAGADISRRALEQIDRPDRTLFEADLSAPFPPEAGGFEAVLALDVIEHVDDDRRVVAGLKDLVMPGGVVVVSVPAGPTMFTEFDAVQGHRRRYLPETLHAAFEGSGLDVEQVFWWGAWMVPLLRRQRSRPRSRPGESAAETYARYLRLPPGPLPTVLRLAFALEHRRALNHKLSTGTSLFAVARRAAHAAEDKESVCSIGLRGRN